MDTAKLYIIRGSLALAGGMLLITLAGCDHDYDIYYGSPYIAPVRSSYYYTPYVGVDYVSYGYPYSRATISSYHYSPYRSFSYGRPVCRSPYRRYSRGHGHRGFRGRGHR